MAVLISKSAVLTSESRGRMPSIYPLIADMTFALQHRRKRGAVIAIQTLTYGVYLRRSGPSINENPIRLYRPNGKTLGAGMNFAIVLILALLLSAPATAAETAAMFAKSVITEPGLHPWTIVTFPDECLVVEFKLDPFVARQRDLRTEFGAIARTVVPAALDKFPKLRSVQLTGLVTVRDKRGNDHEVQAVVVKFYRANSASIKWDTVNPADVIGISDKKSVSPMLAKAVAR